MSYPLSFVVYITLISPRFSSQRGYRSRCIDLAADAETGQPIDSRPGAQLALANFGYFPKFFRIYRGIYDSAHPIWTYGPKVTIDLDVHRHRHLRQPKLSATTSPVVVPQIVGVRGVFRVIYEDSVYLELKIPL